MLLSLSLKWSARWMLMANSLNLPRWWRVLRHTHRPGLRAGGFHAQRAGDGAGAGAGDGANLLPDRRHLAKLLLNGGVDGAGVRPHAT